MADYWIKLYLEIIDDPKMATLPDRLWRRSIELFLLAGRLCTDKSGDLPDINQISWLLRIPSQELHLDMTQLEATGIVQKTNDGWNVINFKKRQAASSNAERKKRERERRNSEQYAGVTDLSRNVTQINRVRLTESESETESETEQKQTIINNSPEFGALCNVYEKNIGPLTQMIAEDLKDTLEEFSLQLCMDAVSEALKNNVRKWSYVRGILKNWKRDGRTSKQDSKTSGNVEYKEVWQDGVLYLQPVPAEVEQ